ncbi:MAG TPA: hypothetical protein VMV72_17365 [Verrucomicrobiae bacterium]|nr:hypothetical protein [Verrucomicrobiae bacterium]
MIEYTIDRTDRLVRVRLSGYTTTADLARHYSKVHSDPAYDPSFNVLFRINDNVNGPIMVDVPSVSGQLEAVARLQNATKWAIVMSPGIRRAVFEFLVPTLSLASVQMRFFDDEHSALAWLDVDHADAGNARQ